MPVSKYRPIISPEADCIRIEPAVCFSCLISLIIRQIIIFFPDLAVYGDASTNAAHNEYLNYLVTVGILGTAAYITALVSTVVHAIRCGKTDLIAPVLCAAIIGYASQAVVSIAQPITTPLFILFVALCAGCRCPGMEPRKTVSLPLPKLKIGYRGRYEKIS